MNVIFDIFLLISVFFNCPFKIYILIEFVFMQNYLKDYDIYYIL